MTPASVETAIGRAVSYLETVQLASGELPVLISTDPEMREGCSADPAIFPTALAAWSLSFSPKAAGVRARAQQFLAGEMDRHGLWRHWPRDHPQAGSLPPDLDDTSCASVALAGSGICLPDNRPVLLANRNRSGRFFTWILPRPTGRALFRATWPMLLRLPTLAMFFRLTSAKPNDVDAVVNANALFHLSAFEGREACTQWLLEILRAGNERSCDKWYENPFLVRYFFARVLTDTPKGRDLLLARTQAQAPATALEHALAATTLIACGADPAPHVQALLASQSEDGSWPRAAVYHGGRARLRAGGFAPPHPDTPRWGSEALTTTLAVEALARSASPRAEAPGVGSFARSYDEVIQSPQMKALYGGSGYFNVGYWKDGPTSLRQACDAMVDELASSLAQNAQVVLDVGNGTGAGTVRLTSLRPRVTVVGVNLSPWQLREGRGRGLVHAVASDAVHLAFADAVADGIIACESPQHFDTREDFLREALRVLKPGGTIALADMLFRDRKPVGSWMLPEGNPPMDPAQYADMLARVGFVEVSVRDVTGLTWTPYCREMQRVFADQSGRLKEIEDSLAHYVIAFARRPASAA